jgi:hypothetical protein
VSTRPLDSTRTRSSGPFPGLKLICGLPLPTFCDALDSLSVLAPTIGCGGSIAWPIAAPPSPNSDGFAALWGIAADRASVPAILAVAISVMSAALPLRDGPLIVERAEVWATFALPSGLPPRVARDGADLRDALGACFFAAMDYVS